MPWVASKKFDEARAIQLYQSGWSTQKAAALLEITPGAMRWCLKKHGVKMRSSRRIGRPNVVEVDCGDELIYMDRYCKRGHDKTLPRGYYIIKRNSEPSAACGVCLREYWKWRHARRKVKLLLCRKGD
jgi:hypothetical protein